MEELGTKCRDVRTREVGIREIHKKGRPEEIELKTRAAKIFSQFFLKFLNAEYFCLLRRDYTANGGWETFLSYEDVEQDILVGLQGCFL